MTKVRRASKLRHRITIEEPDKTKNSLGQIDKSKWIEFDSRRAEWKELSGRELERARQINAEATIGILIRYLPGLNTEMRVKRDDRIAYIAAIIDADGTKESLNLLCIEHS